MRIAATIEILLSVYPSLSMSKIYHDRDFNPLFCFAARREGIDAITSYLKASASKSAVTLIRRGDQKLITALPVVLLAFRSVLEIYSINVNTHVHSHSHLPRCPAEPPQVVDARLLSIYTAGAELRKSNLTCSLFKEHVYNIRTVDVSGIRGLNGSHTSTLQLGSNLQLDMVSSILHFTISNDGSQFSTVFFSDGYNNEIVDLPSLIRTPAEAFFSQYKFVDVATEATRLVGW